MSEVFTDALLGHLVCLVQANAFIMVEWAYLGRGKLRWPVLWAELLCMGQLCLSFATEMPFFNVQAFCSMYCICSLPRSCLAGR